MSISGRKFLKPASALIATLLVSTLQSGVQASPELRNSYETALNIVATEPALENAIPEQITVEPTHIVAAPHQHMSHSSHSSHRSHYSSSYNT